MKKYFIEMNGKIIADYQSYERALNFFRRKVLCIGSGDIVEMYDITGHRCASTI